MAVDLSVIIVNYNGERWLEPCLTSLKTQAAGLAYEVIVVDNASQDDSLTLLRQQFPEVQLISNSENVGFAQANNQGLQIAAGESILLLNNDTIFESGLRAMLGWLAQNPTCGAVGPLMLDGEHQPRGSWGYFPSLGRLFCSMLLIDRLPFLRKRLAPLLVRSSHPRFFTPARPVDWISGACLLLKREVLLRAGPLDPHYFMYGEDVEWCYRFRQAGYQVWVLPEAQLVHFGAGGQEWRSWKGERATLHTFEGFLYFYQKHYPRWQQAILPVVLALGALIRTAGGMWLWLRERDADGRARAQSVIKAYWRVFKLVLGVTRDD